MIEENQHVIFDLYDILIEGKQHILKIEISQNTISNFYDSPRNYGVHHMLIISTIGVDACKFLDQQDMMILRRYYSLFHAYNSSTLSSISLKVKDMFMIYTYLSLG